MTELGIISILKKNYLSSSVIHLGLYGHGLGVWRVCSLLDFAPCSLLQVGLLRCPPLLCSGRLKQVHMGLPGCPGSLSPGSFYS